VLFLEGYTWGGGVVVVVVDGGGGGGGDGGGDGIFLVRKIKKNSFYF